MEQVFEGYHAQDYSPAGDKGRYVLPPAIRNQVKLSSGGKVLCLRGHDRWKCLVGFGTSRKLDLKAQLEREEELAFKYGREFDREIRASQIGVSTEVPFDDSGRFVLRDYLRELGNIQDGLFFQPAIEFFTIWNPEELYKMGDEWNAAKATCRALVAEAEAKAKGKKK